MRLARWIVGTLGALALATAGLVSLAPAAEAAPTTLFPGTNKPGTYANVASVPAGICFVEVTADGGRGGNGVLGSGQGGAGSAFSARVPVTPGTLSVLSLIHI